MGTFGARRIRTVVEEPSLGTDEREVLDLIVNKLQFRDGESIDIESLIGHFGIKLEFRPMESQVSGMLKKEGEHWIITINALHGIKRQRFTMAHEFAHFILHREKQSKFEDIVFFRSSTKDSIEYAANRFAADILMPTEEIKLLKETKGIEELAEIYNVSTLAMDYKLKTIEERNEKISLTS